MSVIKPLNTLVSEPDGTQMPDGRVYLGQALVDIPETTRLVDRHSAEGTPREVSFRLLTIEAGPKAGDPVYAIRDSAA